MNKLQQMLTELKPTHSYRIKFAFEPSKEELSRITTRLNDKYDATHIGALVKTIFHVNPIDFPNMDCGEIWYFDFECTRGIQSDVLLYEIGSMLKVSEAFIKVRNNNDPYQEQIADTEDDDLVLDDYEPLLLDPDMTEVPDYDASEVVGQGRIDAIMKQKRSDISELMSASFGKE